MEAITLTMKLITGGLKNFNFNNQPSWLLTKSNNRPTLVETIMLCANK